jgi:hypothetical protein
MPNWVYTTMTVSGPASSVEEFREKAAMPYRTFHRGKMLDGKYDRDVIVEGESSGVMQFWNFIEPKDKDAYFGHETKPEGYESMSFDERMEYSMKFSTDHWYDWNVRNWGTKWDACNPEVVAHGNGTVTYYFSTAWAPPTGAFQAMVRQHPDLEFSMECIEEQGWGVVYAGENGELEEVRSWDVPRSHSDWIEQGQDCDRCTHHLDQDEWYDDCPRETASV